MDRARKYTMMEIYYKFDKAQKILHNRIFYFLIHEIAKSFSSYYMIYRKWGKFYSAKLSRFRGFLEKHESFSHESFALSTTYKHPGLAPQKYYRENPYNVNTVKV